MPTSENRNDPSENPIWLRNLNRQHNIRRLRPLSIALRETHLQNRLLVLLLLVVLVTIYLVARRQAVIKIYRDTAFRIEQNQNRSLSETRRAQTLLLAVIEEHPDDTEAWFRLGNLSEATDSAMAAEAFGNAVLGNYPDVSAYRRLADLLIQMHRKRSAREVYGEYLRRATNIPSEKKYIARAHEQLAHLR